MVSPFGRPLQVKRRERVLTGSEQGRAPGRLLPRHTGTASLRLHRQSFVIIQQACRARSSALSEDALWPSSAHHSPGLTPATASRLPAPPSVTRSDLFTNVLVAVIWPEGLFQALHGRAQELATYAKMARLINLVPSCLLVFIGAWASQGHSCAALAAVLTSPSVWATAFISSSIAAASCILNDYWDFMSGVDFVNAPNKPLPSGEVPPHTVVLFGCMLYIAVLLAACIMEPISLRIIVAASAAATLLYTPLLKRICCLKNAVVAATIAASPLAGGLASGRAWEGMTHVCPVSAFLFLAFMYRELLMDVADVEGDAAQGVWTLPVVLGRGRAFSAGLGLLTTAICLAVASPFLGLGLTFLDSFGIAWLPGLARAIAAGVIACGLMPAVMDAAAVLRSGYSQQRVSRAIDGMLKPLGLTMILMVVMS
ncbi:hypothetical protein WJX73_005068 [Symbiochloris irregularis]|uniref:Uncharacterized protein n=1 Tax=Symbiochloris irregularis TaxID=706552 RepID=A0AAW1PQA6_9CHLO